MRLLLVGNQGKHNDEGMRNVLHHLETDLRSYPGLEVAVTRPTTLVKNLAHWIRWKPDVIHYIGGPTYKSLLILVLVKRVLPRVRIVVSALHPQSSRFMKQLLHMAAIDKVLVQSSQWDGWMRSNGITSDILVHAGVDLSKFTPVSTAQKAILRTRLQLPQDKRILLHVGHLKDDRNLTSLLSLGKEPDVQVVIVGSTETLVEEALVQTLRDAGCMIVNTFIPAIEEYYQAADCYIFPTVNEHAAIQVPLSVLEAMAANIPVVTTRFGGLVDLFTNGDGFVFIDAENLSQLRDYVLNAISMKPINTRQQVTPFDWKNGSSQLYRLYQQLITPAR